MLVDSGRTLIELKMNYVSIKLMPKGWVSDMATANFTGLKIVYGEEITQKVKGCEFHFDQSLNRRKSTFKDEKYDQYLVSHKTLVS